MDDGFFQLLFFGVLILASVFDAMTRGRRKRRRMEEMEREEDGAGEAGDGTEPTAERETADSMVPDDLWAVLTGQQQPQEGEKPRTASAEPTPLPERVPERRPPPEPKPPPKPARPRPRFRSERSLSGLRAAGSHADRCEGTREAYGGAHS